MVCVEEVDLECDVDQHCVAEAADCDDYVRDQD